KVGHREARRLAADEQARDAKIVEPDGNREAGAAVGEMKVQQDQIRLILLGGGDSAFGILGHRHNAITRIVLDQIFERDGQLTVVLDNEDIEHSRPLPTLRNSLKKSVTC